MVIALIETSIQMSLQDASKMAKKKYFSLQPHESLVRHLRTTAYCLQIRPLVREYLAHGGNPPRHRVQEQEDYVRNIYLPGIRHEVAPHIEAYANSGKVKAALETLKDPNTRLPEDITTQAAELLQFFESSGWKARKASVYNRALIPSITAPQFREHRIFAPGGIMHNMIPNRGIDGRGSLTFAPDATIAWREHDEYGDNGLEVGQWFARRGCAIMAGATNQPQRGICGDKDRGAYAIVVGGAYDDLDCDQGDVLYYSSEGANNAQPGQLGRHVELAGNQALAASLRYARPVRVLRGAKKFQKHESNLWAPSCGLRYDGLYRVVRTEMKKGTQGGEYVRFKLERLPGQKSLKEVVRESPTAQQIEEFEALEKLKQLL